MTSSSQLQLRATDADRDRVVQMLRVAAEEGALTVDELEERLSAAFAAVTRADLVRLVDDLPPSAATPPPPVPAPVEPVRTSSRYWLWALSPYLAAGAWVHAAVLTRSGPLATGCSRPCTRSHRRSLPSSRPVSTTRSRTGSLRIAVVFWIVNAIHVWTARPDVNAAWARARAAARSSAR